MRRVLAAYQDLFSGCKFFSFETAQLLHALAADGLAHGGEAAVGGEATAAGGLRGGTNGKRREKRAPSRDNSATS
jgi:hypothetical protein